MKIKQEYRFLLSIILIQLSLFVYSQTSWGIKKFTTSDGLMSNQLDALFIDSKGLLWIANGNGITRYDGKSFINYLNDSMLTPINKINPFSIIELKDGSIFYSMKYGYVKTSHKKKKYLDIFLSDTLAEKGENGVTDKNGIRYFKRGFIDYDFENSQVINKIFKNYPDNYSFPSNLLCSNLGNVFYSFYNKEQGTRTLYLYQNNTFKKICTDIEFIMAGIFETEKYYYILPDKFTSAYPVIIINKKDLSKIFFKKSHSIPDISLIGNGLLHKNNLVFPAYEGVFIISEKKEQYFINDAVAEKIKDKYEDKNFLSLSKGLYLYNNFIVNGYRLVDIEVKKIHIPENIKAEMQKGNYIVEVMPDEEGNIWYATSNGLLQLYPLPYYPLYKISENKIAEVNDSIENNRFTCIKKMEKIEYCLTNTAENIQILIPEIKDKFYKYDLKTKVVSPIYVQGLQSPVLRERLYPLLAYKKLIICQEYTRGIIIYRLNETLDTAYYQLFNYSNGLLSNYVENVFVDKNENIWLITWDGIQVIHYQDLLNEDYEQAKKYSESFQLDMIPFMRGQDIYFANRTMLYKIPTDKILFNQKPPSIIIETFSYQAGDRTYEIQFKQDSTYELPYNFKELHLSFIGVCLSDRSKVRYRYVLDEITHQQNEGEIILNKLSAGTHTIKIYASNNFNIWNKQPIRFYINVLPPFWETWWFRITSVIVLAVVIIFIIKKREYDLKQRQQELEHLVNIRTKELAEKSQLIEQKNKEILDSIYYTKRLQLSSIPSEKEIKRIFPNSFVIYIPKDIISGDFYFAGEIRTNEGEILRGISVGDCTGHGVPGAFMSILTLAYIKQSLTERSVNSPADALEFVSKKIQKVLEYKDIQGDVKDSADMVFAVIDKKYSVLRCACGNNPIYIVRNKNLIEIPAQKRTVGYSDNLQPFINHDFPLQKGDTIYLFSDGYADQFGKENHNEQIKDKKFTKKRFKNILIEISSLEPEIQKQELLRIHQEWKRDIEQTDDICIVGIKV